MNIIKLKSNYLRHFLLLVRVFGIYLFLWLYVGVFKNDLGINALLITSIIIFILDTLPAIIVHLQYLAHEYKVKIEISEQEKKLFYFNKGQIKIYDLKELTKLESYLSYAGGSGVNAWSEYEFYRISFLNGEQLIVTNLRTPNFGKEIANITGLIPEKKMGVISFLPPIGKL